MGSSGALAAVDFDYNYTPVSEQYPAVTPGNYVVSAGDTLRSIALAVYGDAHLWYLIADANGLQTDAELTVGSNLTIPNKVTNLRNAYDTFKPYEPGKIVGDLTPTLPEPPPPDNDDGGCGGLGRIIVAIVAVVATVLTAGAMAPVCTGTIGGLWGAGMAALGSNVGIALVAGAVGSIASQAVGIALGVQDEFSWGAVAMSAIGAGVSAGLGASGSPLAGEGPGLAIARAVVGNVVTQGIGVAVGLQDKFDWKGVAAAGVGTGVSVGLGQILPLAETPFGGILRETAIGFASGVAKQSVYGGKINFANAAADAFGNALGTSLAFSAMAGNSAAQQTNTLAEAEIASGSGLRLGGGLGLRVPAGLALTWGEAAQVALDDFDEEEIPGGGVGSDIPGSQSGSNPPVSGLSLAITASRNTPGAERVELIGAATNAPDTAPSVLTLDEAQAFKSFESFFRSNWINGKGELPILLPGDSMVPAGAKTMIQEGYDVEGGMSFAAKVLASFGLTDRPTQIYRTFSLPLDAQKGPLADYLNDYGQLKDGVTLNQFAEAAANAGYKLAVHDNGILNSYWQSIAHGTAWATENKVVAVNIYNPTSSAVFDSLETGAEVMFGVDAAAVSATRLAIKEVVKINGDNFKDDPYTLVVSHSQGTAISNAAIAELPPKIQEQIDLRNVGTATGQVPAFLHSYRSVVNTLDSTPMVVGNILGLGGAGTSPGYLSAVEAGRDYQIITTTFDVKNDSFNHSLMYYFSDPTTRAGLGYGSLTPQLKELYKTAPWIQK